ncbi:MAG: hypothetical protein ACRESK_10815 [Gammaproteobacteria bacterium]
MKIRRHVILALAILIAGILLSPSASAGGYRHGHRHGHYYGGGDSINFGFGFVFPIYSYGYYPYYDRRPVYIEQGRMPTPATLPEQPAYSASQEEPAYCREYTKSIIVDGKEEMAYGTACLQEDGNWRIMN